MTLNENIVLFLKNIHILNFKGAVLKFEFFFVKGTILRKIIFCEYFSMKLPETLYLSL